MNTEQNILSIVNQLDEMFSKHQTLNNDPLYDKRYDGAGQKVAKMYENNQVLKNQGKELMHYMNTELDIWVDYMSEYFKSSKMKLEYGTEEYKDILRRSGFAVHRLYDINMNKMYKRSDKFGHIDIDELCKINKRNMYEWWGRLLTDDTDEELVEGQVYTFNLSLPISDDIPTFDEYKKTWTKTTKEDKINALIKKEEEQCGWDENNDNYLTTDDFLRRIMKYKKSQAKKNNKKVYKYDKNGNVVTIFADREQCMRIDGMNKSTLSNIISGRRKYYQGYSYKEV